MMQWNNDNGPKLLWIGLVVKVFFIVSYDFYGITEDIEWRMYYVDVLFAI